MLIFPNSKINIGLQIVKKRTDGFHNINTVFYPIPWNDAIEIKKQIRNNASDLKIKIEVFGINVLGDIFDNILVKAYNILSEKHELPPIEVKLLKSIPIGAGLGGGSSDAAFFLKSLNSYFQLKISEFELLQIASSLGSDCAFFIKNKPVYASGKGDEFNEIEVDLKGKFLVAVYPDCHSNTALAYQGVVPKEPQVNLKEVIHSKNISEWKGLIENDFEPQLFDRFPVIGKYKNKLYQEGALYASMSGSGSAIFGIFEKKINFKLLENNHKMRCFEL